jgi:hypothetical protein
MRHHCRSQLDGFLLPDFEESMRILQEALLPELGTAVQEETMLSRNDCQENSTADVSIIFVSTDIEPNGDDDKRSGRPIREIGICTLDTRHLSQTSIEPHTILSTQNYQWKDGPNQMLSRKFLFGESKRIVPEDMRALLERAFRITDENGEARRIIVVGHGIKNELCSMKAIGIDLTNRIEFPSIVGMLDTVTISQPAISTGHKFRFPKRLINISERLEIPCHCLHVAGNDAHFTLKVLLMLAPLLGQMAEGFEKWCFEGCICVGIDHVILSGFSPEGCCERLITVALNSPMNGLD